MNTSLPKQIITWVAVIAVATIATAIFLGPKAASYTGGGLIVAAVFKIRERLAGEEERENQ